jgi:hypothetical protein
LQSSGLLTSLATVACLASGLAPVAAADYSDPSWPCVQRKVESLSLGQMWAGPAPEGDWRRDPEARALAMAIAPRRTTPDEIEALVSDFAATLPEAERGPRLALAFDGVLSLIDSERGQLINGIGRYAQNQTARSRKVEELQNELATLDAAEEKNMDRIEELQDTLVWEARIFRDRAQALTYVCETPVLLEQRAFAIARIIAAAI